eukprot:scpid93125/ scgid21248/ 
MELLPQASIGIRQNLPEGERRWTKALSPLFLTTSLDFCLGTSIAILAILLLTTAAVEDEARTGDISLKVPLSHRPYVHETRVGEKLAHAGSRLFRRWVLNPFKSMQSGALCTEAEVLKRGLKLNEVFLERQQLHVRTGLQCHQDMVRIAKKFLSLV